MIKKYNTLYYHKIKFENFEIKQFTISYSNFTNKNTTEINNLYKEYKI